MKRNYCINKDCKMADTCLRQLLIDSTTNSFIGIVNPKMASGDETCKFYFPRTTERHAKGFITMLDNMPTKIANSFRSTMLLYVPRNQYFQMRRGDLLITPQRQKLIQEILEELKYECSEPFDGYVEVEKW